MPTHECFFLVCATLAACGGRVADDDFADADSTHDGAPDDSPADVDAELAPDAATCISGETSSEQTDAACATVSSYACGETAYTISCSCPEETCQCESHSPTTSTAEIVSVPSLCPGCGFTLPEYAALCGFPN
ncbi:MAG TPA: hypothetical protein VGH28_00300 [Polyangiaceae bacterium]